MATNSRIPSDTKALSIYDSLKLGGYETRLLRFVSGASTSRVACTLEKYSLVHDIPQYVVLSHSGLDEEASRNIVINGYTVPVSTDLEQALWQLSHQPQIGTHVLVWVNNLCINQDDAMERSLQVRLRKQIHERAHTILVWLGVPDTPEAAQNMIDNIQALVNKIPVKDWPRYDTLSASDRKLLPPAFEAVMSIITRPFWQQRGIIQEFVIGQEIVIIFGSAHTLFRTFFTAYELCIQSELWIIDKHKQVADHFDNLYKLRNVYHTDSIPLDTVLDGTFDYACKNPLDTIHAILGIASDGVELIPIPNYFQTTKQLSAELTRAWLDRKKSLDIIFKGIELNTQPRSLPTWSPDWCATNAEDSRTAIRTLHKAPITFPDWRMFYRSDRGSEVLQVKGVGFGTVVAMTTSWNCDRPFVFSKDHAQFRSSVSYYGSRRELGRTLTDLILCQDMVFKILPAKYCPGAMSNLYRLVPRNRISGRIYLSICDLILRWKQDLSSKGAILPYKRWLQANKAFLIDGNPIDRHIRLSNAFDWDSVALPVILVLSILSLLVHTSQHVWNFMMGAADTVFPQGQTYATWLVATTLACLTDSDVYPTTQWPLYANLAIVAIYCGLTLLQLPTGLLVFSLFMVFVAWLAPNIDMLRLIYVSIWNWTPRLEYTKTLDSRVVVLDNGALGISRISLRPSDLVCIIAGCSEAVVLRPAENKAKEQYMIVGSIIISLNEEDSYRYGILLTAGVGIDRDFKKWTWTRWGPWLRREKVTEKPLFERCTKEDGFRTYDLI